MTGHRVAFVTSAAKGLGHATARSMMDAGWDLCFTYGSSQLEADELLVYANRLGRKALALPVDLLDKSEVEKAVSICISEFSHVDALIHNFGPFVFERLALAEYGDDLWQRMLDGNLNNFYWLYQSVVDGMRTRGFGRVITMGYAGAGTASGWRFRAAYAAAKAGLASLTRSIAQEERQNGITANMVCPGDIRGEAKMQRIADVEDPYNPLGRPPVGEDIARMIALLCDENSQQLNGTVTEITGGYEVLAYDDGVDIIPEQEVFALGECVFVHPWGREGKVSDIVKIPNRNTVYHVSNGIAQGTFTMYQLSHSDEGDIE